MHNSERTTPLPPVRRPSGWTMLAMGLIVGATAAIVVGLTTAIWRS